MSRPMAGDPSPKTEAEGAIPKGRRESNRVMRATCLVCAFRRWAFLVLAGGAVLAGCGDPQAPKIENVRLAYQDPADGSWVDLLDGDNAPASPIRISGKITDNTAVVDPRVTLMGKRRDAEDVAFSCEPAGDFYACDLPAIPAEDLTRGDRIFVQELDGDTVLQEVQLWVSEFDDVSTSESFRLLKLSTSVEGPGDLVRSLYREPSPSGRLRSGDALRAGSQGSDLLRLYVRAPDGRAFSGLAGTWYRKDLFKWNQRFSLDVKPTDGTFSAILQLFDPSEAGRPLDLAPAYDFTISAYDAPDQKKDVGRYAERTLGLVFWPPRGETEAPDGIRQDLFPPNIELEGIEEDTEAVSTEAPTQVLSGSVLDNAGEIRSLQIRLSNRPAGEAGDPGYREKILFYDPGWLSLAGVFAANLRFCSDWDENGVIDVLEEGKGVPNYVQVVARDINGLERDFPSAFSYEFVPPATDAVAPGLDLSEVDPKVDASGQGSLPAGEILRIRGVASDNSGQPKVEWYECPNCPEPPTGDWQILNENLCACSLKRTFSGDPAGQFPDRPWEWIEISSEALLAETVHVLRAAEKVRSSGKTAAALFSGREVRHFDDEEDPNRFVVLPLETLGPLVNLIGPQPVPDGTVLTEEDPEIEGAFIADFGKIEATVSPHYSRLNQIVARVFGGRIQEEPGRCKQPSYNGDAGKLEWDLGRVSVREGDRVCMGGVSLTGHAVLYLWQFERVGEGLRAVWSISYRIEDCPQQVQEFPCSAGFEVP